MMEDEIDEWAIAAAVKELFTSKPFSAFSEIEKRLHDMAKARLVGFSFRKDQDINSEYFYYKGMMDAVLQLWKDRNKYLTMKELEEEDEKEKLESIRKEDGLSKNTKTIKFY